MLYCQFCRQNLPETFCYIEDVFSHHHRVVYSERKFIIIRFEHSRAPNKLSWSMQYFSLFSLGLVV